MTFEVFLKQVLLCVNQPMEMTQGSSNLLFLGWEKTSVYSKVAHWKVSEGWARYPVVVG